MDENIKLLIKKFKIIAQKGWIKSISKSTGSIGLTFEKELDKKADNTYFPDYYGIEIKCTGRYSSYPLSLFSLAFEGPTFPEINRLLDKYGYPDKTFPTKKVLFANISNKKQYVINKKYIFKLDVDINNGKIYLCVYDSNYNLIERKSYIYIDTLYEHLNLKLNRLAIIYGSIKKENNSTYFKYYNIIIYKLNNKENFLQALQQGLITTQLVVNTRKSGYRVGKTKNKNLSFLLDKNNVGKVFDEIYSYNFNNNIEKIIC